MCYSFKPFLQYFSTSKDSRFQQDKVRILHIHFLIIEENLLYHSIQYFFKLIQRTINLCQLQNHKTIYQEYFGIHLKSNSIQISYGDILYHIKNKLLLKIITIVGRSSISTSLNSINFLNLSGCSIVSYNWNFKNSFEINIINFQNINVILNLLDKSFDFSSSNNHLINDLNIILKSTCFVEILEFNYIEH